MTHTFRKYSEKNTSSDRSSAANSFQLGEPTPETDLPSPRPLSSQKQAAPEERATQLLKPVGQEQQPRSSITLRQQLLMTVLPTVLVPLAIASAVSYNVLEQRTNQQLRQKLQDETLLTGELTIRIVSDAQVAIASVATNPLIIDAARAASQKAEADQLDRVPIAELDRRFAATKLLQPNQRLNDYLIRLAKIQEIPELFFTERNGFNVAFSNATSDFVQRDEEWWQKAKRETQSIDKPQFDESANTFEIKLHQAILDPKTGEFLGIAEGGYPASKFNLLETFLQDTDLSDSQQVQLLDPRTGLAINTVTAQGISDTREVVGGEAIVQVTTSLIKLLQNPRLDLEQALSDLKMKYSLQQLTITRYAYGDGEKTLIATFVHQGKLYTLATVPKLNWAAVTSIDTTEIVATGRELLLVFGLTALVVGAVAVGVVLQLARRLSAPLQDLSIQAAQVSSGNLDVAAELRGTAETQTLAQTFNQLVAGVKGFLRSQEVVTEQARLLAEVTGSRAVDIEALQDIFDKALSGVRAILQLERVVIYRLYDGSGEITVESVAPGWPRALQQKIQDSCIPKHLLAAYQEGRVVPTNDVWAAGFHPDHLKLMENLEVKANLVVPILSEGKLFGLLIAHHCSTPHDWQPTEINFLQQLAAQWGTCLDRVTLLEQTKELATEQRQLKEGLQKRAMELLMEVDPIAQGDLTIRAKVTEDEIGTIADSYNATVSSLRKIVTQVQSAASLVTQTTSSNSVSVQTLSQEALRQAEEIAVALRRIQDMAQSVRLVAANAQQAEVAVQQARQTVAEGDAAMNRTVEGILAIRETVAATAKKVKHLGESSQKISTVVNLISTFADQSNLLALNASIEAARAGEEGRGFAVVAEEVRVLARQSAAATTEIEKLVAGIQAETNEVVAAMEAGSEQVVTGTKLVDETRASLTKITAASAEINQLVETIAQATVVQSQASEAVTQTMANVAAIADHTSTEAILVSSAFEQLRAVAEALQADVGQFKVQ